MTQSMRVFAALSAINLIWGSTFAAIKLGLDGFAPFLMAGLRFASAGLVLALIARLSRWERLSVASLGRAAVPGILMTFSNALVCWSEVEVDSGIAALVITLIPVMMVLLNWVSFEKRAPSVVALTGLVVSCVGLALITAPSIDPSRFQREFPYIAGLFVASFFWSVASLQQRGNASAPKLPFFQNLAIQTFVGGMVLLVLSVLLGEKVRPMSQWPWASVGAIVYLSLIGTVIAYSCYVYALRRSTPEVVSTYALVNPVVAIVIGVLFLNESWSARLSGATALILSGVGLVLFEKRILKQLSMVWALKGNIFR